MNSAEEKIEKMVNINLIIKLLTTTDSPLAEAEATTNITNGAKIENSSL